MYRQIFCYVIYFFIVSFSYSQTNEIGVPDFSIHSPDAANLGKYGEYPVNFSNGVPSINIPLYTVESGSLKMPLSVSYHSAGIKVEQEASFIGLGWVLNSGGVITRVVRDKPDESYLGFLNSGSLLPDYNPIDQNTEGGDLSMGGAVGNSSELETWYNNYDKEPDLFSINAIGLSGEFILNNSSQFITTDFEPLKIEADLISNTIVITDKMGTIYRFGKSLNGIEAFESTNSFTSSSYLNGSTGYAPQYPDHGTYTSSWYLTELISSDKTDTISFTYTTKNYTNNKIVNFSRYILNAGGPLATTDQIGQNFDGTIRTDMHSNIPNVRIPEKIILKEGEISFQTVADRLDIASGVESNLKIPRMTGFTVLNNDGNVVQKVEFDNNAYFDRTGNGLSLNFMEHPEKWKKSLKLRGVNFLDSEGQFLNDYNFHYDPTPLPPLNASSQDFWGYYNGKNNSSLIPQNFYMNSFSGSPVFVGESRESDFNYMKAAILYKINFPTGGSTQFVYEPNYYLNQSQKELKTERTKNISLFAVNKTEPCSLDWMEGVPPSNTLEFEVTEDFGNQSNIPGVLTVMFSDYKITQGQSMTFKITDLNNGNNYSFQHIPSEMSEHKVFNLNLMIYNGHRYRLEANTNGVSGSEMGMCNSPYIEASLRYSYWETSTIEEIVPKQAGGLRVKKITSFDVEGQILSEKRYKYGTNEYGLEKVGVGRLISDPSKNYSNYPLLYAVTPETQELKNVLWFNSSGHAGMGYNNGCPVEYEKVTEFTVSYNDPDLSTGKTEYHYSPIGKYVEPKSSTKFPYDTFSYPTWMDSHPIREIYFKQLPDLSFDTIRSIDYKYYEIAENRIKTLKIFENEPDRYSAFNGPSWYYLEDNPNRFYYYNYFYSLGRKLLAKEITKEYENGIASSINIKDFFYENLDHLQVTRSTETESNGNKIEVITSYPDDVISIESLGYDTLTGSEFQAISRFKKNDIHRIAVPVQVETIVKDQNGTEVSKTATRTSFDNLTGDLVLPRFIQYSKNTDLFDDRIEYLSYDGGGNPTQIKKTNGATITYLWGYNYSRPVAKIENATYSQVMAALGKTANDNLNFLQEFQETQIREEIQKIRSGLPEAMVSTYTYLPLVGVTSITDPAGRIILYQYDNFNRLKYIKNSEGHILKEFNYHYKNSN